MLILALSLLSTFLAAWFLVGRFRVYALAQGLLDNPNARSSHTVATPCGGGLVFISLWLIAGGGLVFFGEWPLAQTLVFLPGALLLAIIGYWDDRYDVPAQWRILVHCGVAGGSLMALGVMDLPWGWMGAALAFFAMVWSINLFNFMDGADGIASVEALFVLGVGGFFLWQAGGAVLAVSAWALAAAVAGFLPWNWPRAKIFMGDVGSSVLGFLIAGFALAGQAWLDVPLVLWVILYGTFWFDATVTLARRVMAGERWYLAHRSHAYQRLHHPLGWSHGRILWGVIAVNSMLAGLALWAHAMPDMALVALGMAVALLCIAYGLVERVAPMYVKNTAMT